MPASNASGPHRSSDVECHSRPGQHARVDAHANVCWSGCPGGLAYDGVPVQWLASRPGHFTMQFTIPAAAGLDASGIHPLAAKNVTVGVQCLDLPVSLKKGPGFVGCAERPAQATATFHLTNPTIGQCHRSGGAPEL